MRAETNPVAGVSLVGVLAVLGVTAVAYSIAKALRPEFVPPSAPTVAPDVLGLLQDYPAASLVQLADILYQQRHPECPSFLDPDDPDHVECMKLWIAGRQELYEHRKRSQPANLVLISDGLEQKLEWPTVLQNATQPIVTAVYREGTPTATLYQSMMDAARTNPQVFFLMAEDGAVVGAGGQGIDSDCVPTAVGYIGALSSFLATDPDFSDCWGPDVTVDRVIADVHQATTVARAA